MKEQYIHRGSYIQSPLFIKHGVRHLFTCKQGGVSTGVYESFNFAAGSGETPDAWENVVENHRIAARLLGCDVGDICRSYQTHTANVAVVTAADRGRGIFEAPFAEGVDGLVTAESGVLLSVRGADCVTLLLYDTKSGAVAAAHSGWRGTAEKIAAVALYRLLEMGAAAEDVIAAIGPSARSCCYFVGEEVQRAFSKEPFLCDCFEERDGKVYADLQRAVAQTLMACGVKDEHISDCGECSVCNPDRYFSHRRSGVNRGTMAAFIVGGTEG